MNEANTIDLFTLEILCRRWSNACGRDVTLSEALRLEREMKAWMSATTGGRFGRAAG